MTNYQKPQPQPRPMTAARPFVPEWRRRMLDEMAANGGRIVARSLTTGGSVAL